MLAVAAVREKAVRDAKRSLARASVPSRRVSRRASAQALKVLSKVMLSGGREGLEVRAGLTEGSGMGLFAGPRDVPAGGFIALHRGVWSWTGDSGGEYDGKSAYAISLDNWLVAPVVRHHYVLRRSARQ